MSANQCPKCQDSTMLYFGSDQWRCPACGQTDYLPEEIDLQAAIVENIDHFRGPATHGGARRNSGRRAVRGETVVMRVPVAYKAAIQELMNHLDVTAEINRHYAPITSQPVFIRSLQLNAQQITFTTAPVGTMKS